MTYIDPTKMKQRAGRKTSNPLDSIYPQRPTRPAKGKDNEKGFDRASDQAHLRELIGRHDLGRLRPVGSLTSSADSSGIQMAFAEIRAVLKSRQLARGESGRTKLQGGLTSVRVRRGRPAVAQLLEACELYYARIVGGYARYMCSPVENPIVAEDVDVFFVANTVHEAVANFDGMRRTLESKGLVIESSSKWAIRFARPSAGPYSSCPPIHLVRPRSDGNIRTFGPLDSFVERVDFSVAAIGLNESHNSALAAISFEQDEMARVLRVFSFRSRGLHYRLQKYLLKGYRPGPLFDRWEGRVLSPPPGMFFSAPPAPPPPEDPNYAKMAFLAALNAWVAVATKAGFGLGFGLNGLFGLLDYLLEYMMYYLDEFDPEELEDFLLWLEAMFLNGSGTLGAYP